MSQLTDFKEAFIKNVIIQQLINRYLTKSKNGFLLIGNDNNRPWKRQVVEKPTENDNNNKSRDTTLSLINSI